MLVVTISGPHMVWRERFRAVRLYRGMRPGLEAGRGGTRSFRKARIEGNGERPVCPRVPPEFPGDRPGGCRFPWIWFEEGSGTFLYFASLTFSSCPT